MFSSTSLTKSLALGTLLAAVFSGSAFASNIATVKGDSVTLRSYNANEAKAIAYASKNEELTIVANANNGWYKIVKRDGTGTTAFINSDYMAITQTDATCVVDGVNVRCRPTTESAPYGKANKGDVFVTTGRYKDWYQIRYNGYTGYIHKDYMQGSLLSELNEITLPESVTNPEKFAAQKQGETVAVVSAKTAQQEMYGVVTSDSLNMREYPNADCDIVKVLPNGYNVTILNADGKWLEVEDDDGDKGYVNGSYLTLKNGEKPENEDQSFEPAEEEEEAYNPNDVKPEDFVPVIYNSTGKVTASELLGFAENYVGTPYVFGGTDLVNGVDCSGFVYSVYGNFGIKLNRTSRDMYRQGEVVEMSELEPGDLVFFNTGGNSAISHVGMYYGDGKYIHSTDGAAKGVTIADFYGAYPQNTYVGARRILK